MDVIYEILLKMGVPLTETIISMDFDSITAYSVGKDCLLLVCLQEGATTEIIEHMVEYAPAKIILSESCLADDTEMANAQYALQDRGITLKLV